MKAKIIYDEQDYDSDDVSVISGGLSTTPKDWSDYLNMVFKDEYHHYFEAIRQAIIEANLVGVCADKVANIIWFEMEDGKIYGFSWRGWGDLMAAIVGKGENYMQYYCS